VEGLRIVEPGEGEHLVAVHGPGAIAEALADGEILEPAELAEHAVTHGFTHLLASSSVPGSAALSRRRAAPPRPD
jgi:hypothetical protein